MPECTGYACALRAVLVIYAIIFRHVSGNEGIRVSGYQGAWKPLAIGYS